MSFARVNGVLLNYRLTGPTDGPVLGFVNSLGTDARIWDEVIPALAPDYRILSYDKRGHGLSDAPAAPYALEDHVGDLEALLARLKIGRLALIGVSVGGLIAQRFAIKHQEQVAGLVLCDTAAKIGTDEFWNMRIVAVRAGGIASISDAILERWFSPAYRQSQPEQLAGWRNMLERSPPEGYMGSCYALREADLREQVGGIKLKTLVVCGDADSSTPPSLVQETAARLPNARFELIKDAGHLPNIEQPQALIALLRNYLSEVGFG